MRVYIPKCSVRTRSKVCSTRFSLEITSRPLKATATQAGFIFRSCTHADTRVEWILVMPIFDVATILGVTISDLLFLNKITPHNYVDKKQ